MLLILISLLEGWVFFFLSCFVLFILFFFLGYFFSAAPSFALKFWVHVNDGLWSSVVSCLKNFFMHGFVLFEISVVYQSFSGSHSLFDSDSCLDCFCRDNEMSHCVNGNCNVFKIGMKTNVHLPSVCFGFKYSVCLKFPIPDVFWWHSLYTLLISCSLKQCYFGIYEDPFTLLGSWVSGNYAMHRIGNLCWLYHLMSVLYLFISLEKFSEGKKLMIQ